MFSGSKDGSSHHQYGFNPRSASVWAESMVVIVQNWAGDSFLADDRLWSAFSLSRGQDAPREHRPAFSVVALVL